MKNDAMTPPVWLTVLVLVGCFVVSQLIWSALIRPNADLILQTSGSAALTSPFVVLKDLEQQVCFALMCFSFFLMGHKLLALTAEKPVYTHDFLANFPKDQALNVQDALDTLEASDFSNNKVTLTWIDALRRFRITGNVHDAAEAITSSVESLSMNLESGNGLIRYIIWAIPSIGFIGTVRGIGQALAQAESALDGDIAGMTASLGVAFNSTLVALFISIALMFLMHLLNRQQDMMVMKTQESCERYLLAHLHR